MPIESLRIGEKYAPNNAGKRSIPGDLVNAASIPKMPDSKNFSLLKKYIVEITKAIKRGSGDPTDLTISHRAGNIENKNVIQRTSFLST